ncbi:MAG: ABC transporter permease, partial [Anaerolineae bacterium]|nr:ABC transporter permease [Anaerolineae bacterium]
MAASSRPIEERQAPSPITNFLLRQEVILFLILILAVVLLALSSDKFLTISNILNQGRLLTEIGLVALPMTFIIITGGIDLSVGSILGVCAIVLGYMWNPSGPFQLPLEAAIVVSLALGTLCGLVNGLIIVYIGVPPLITTLATLALYRG